MNIRLSEIIAPVFYNVHISIKNNEFIHYWLIGGRRKYKVFVCIN
nr:MAG TPA: hypothetical protein [Caudoviricetes sp.]DAS04620.1 MAG TPA: hypothetical protein [Caudoviricetes sp.]